MIMVNKKVIMVITILLLYMILLFSVSNYIQYGCVFAKFVSDNHDEIFAKYGCLRLRDMLLLEITPSNEGVKAMIRCGNGKLTTKESYITFYEVENYYKENCMK